MNTKAIYLLVLSLMSTFGAIQAQEKRNQQQGVGTTTRWLKNEPFFRYTRSLDDHHKVT
jgi:hypothetical protein